MSNIHVPIDSNLSEVIPKGEDILYSVDCRAELKGRGKKANWKTPILVTKSGFASFTRMEKYLTNTGKTKYNLRKKNLGMIITFTPWVELGLGASVKKTPFTKNRIVHVITNFRWLHYVDIRKTKLGDFCRNLWRDQTGL